MMNNQLSIIVLVVLVSALSCDATRRFHPELHANIRLCREQCRQECNLNRFFERFSCVIDCLQAISTDNVFSCPNGLDPCSESPCQNGGECSIAESNTYTCTCTEGFAGQDCERVCNTPLGMEDGRIDENQISASSTWLPNYGPQYARLNNMGDWPRYTGSWSAATSDLNQWIQVAFDNPQMIDGIITQGRSSANNDPNNQYVTKYKVEYSVDGTTWNNVQDASGQDAEFNGNFDRDTPVTNMFESPVEAMFVRIRPTEWNRHISMRFEVLGCQEPEM